MTSVTDQTEDQAVKAERARRRNLLLATVLLLIGLPIYLIAASWIVTVINPVVQTPEGPARALHWSVEILVYALLGVVWAFPLKGLMKGLGRPTQGG